MFSFLRTNRPVERGTDPIESLACFGKLPLRPDFIKYNVSQREVLGLDSWVQEGYALMSRRHGGIREESFAAAPIHHAVLAGTAEERCLLATIAPSRDQSGRPYPFVIVDRLGPLHLSELPSALPVAYRRFFDGAATLARQHWRNEPVTTVSACVEALKGTEGERSRLALQATQNALLAQTPVDALWSALPADADLRARILHGLLDSLRAAGRRSAHRTAWALRLPLPSECDPLPVIAFWVNLAQSVLGQASWRPAFYWTERAATPARLTLFMRPAPASFLAHLFDPSLRDGLVVDVHDEPVSQASAFYRAAATETAGTLLDLLRYLGEGR